VLFAVYDICGIVASSARLRLLVRLPLRRTAAGGVGLHSSPSGIDDPPLYDARDVLNPTSNTPLAV